MSYNIIGEQIQKFRKREGITQRELGEAISVSSSAVSQWESGGTPDVSLLPAIADRLHVTIDMLFGREAGEGFDVTDAVCRWARTLPEKDFYEKTVRLIFDMLKGSVMEKLGSDSVGYSRTAEMGQEAGKNELLNSYVTSEYGEMVGVFADDLSFVTVLPEPEKGYKAYFSPNEEYRRLFSVLSEPDVLEIMQYLAGIEYKYFTPGAIAKRLNKPAETVAKALSSMAEVKLVSELNLENEDGNTHVYIIMKQHLFAPFLFFSRLMLQSGFVYLMWDMRETPLLRESNQ